VHNPITSDLWLRAGYSEKWNWSSLDMGPHGPLMGMRNHALAPSTPKNERSFVLSEAELFDVFDMAFVFCDSAEWASVSAGAYEGSWISGHPTKGVGGPPSYPTFSQNPAHPISVSQTSKLAVVLSRVVEEAVHEADDVAASSQTRQQLQQPIPIGWVVLKQDDEGEGDHDISGPGTIVVHCNAYQVAR
jgi:hypothetical protein